MLYLALYATFCIAFAWINYYLIEEMDRKIYHGLNGALHLIMIGLLTSFEGFKIGIAALFVARLFFDVSLNLFRGKKIGYVSPKPKSIIDRLEKSVFKNNGVLPKIIYATIIILIFII